jgi:hypothetical protein
VELQTKCRERACQFPADGSDGHCSYHRTMFSVIEEEDFPGSESAFDLELKSLHRRFGRSKGHNSQQDAKLAFVFDGGASVNNPSNEKWVQKKERQADKRMFNTLSCRRLFKRRREAGFCNCGKIRAQGYKSCPDCLRHALERMKRLRDSGLCVACGNKPPAAGHIRCQSCLEIARITRKTPNPLEKSMSAKNRRQARVSTGLCADCGKTRDDPRKLCCKDCRVKNNQALAKLRKRLRAAGICAMCGRKKKHRDVDICRACALKKKRSRFERRAARRREGGLCADCGRATVRLGTSCSSCLKRLQARSHRANYRLTRIQSGLCVDCGMPRGGDGTKTLCSLCSQKLRDLASKRKLLGLCVSCGESREDPTKSRCVTCLEAYRTYVLKFRESKRLSAVKDGGTEATP